MNRTVVIDAICGSGKTTYIFEHMKANKDKRWLFVSPYLSETGDGKTKGRIQQELPEMNFKSPSATPNKTESFKRLAAGGCSNYSFSVPFIQYGNSRVA